MGQGPSPLRGPVNLGNLRCMRVAFEGAGAVGKQENLVEFSGMQRRSMAPRMPPPVLSTEIC